MRSTSRFAGSIRSAFLVMASFGLVAAGCANDTSSFPMQGEIFASVTEGTAPLEVAFHAVVVGASEPLTYSWNFGDGTEDSAEAAPVHTFNEVGRFDVLMVVSDGGGETGSRTLQVTVHEDLGVAITVTPTSGTAPLQVAASCDVSGGKPPHRFEWDFGDGTTSASEVASNHYMTGGTYTVTLTVRDALNQAARAETTVTVRDDHRPVAAIQVAPVVGIAPLEVAFDATVAGGDAPLTYEWLFGDGGKATSAQAEHTYQDAGRYTAVLVVTDADGDQSTDTVSIQVATDDQPVVAAEATPTSGVAPLSVRFTAQTAGGNAPLTFGWDFDEDGKVDSVAASPVHTFAAGTHEVEVTVTDADGDTASDTIEVTVQTDTVPVATAAATPAQGRAPLAVAFECTATGLNLPYAIQWDFGDGTTGASATPSHTYGQAGTYTATCTVIDADGDVATDTVEVVVAADREPSVVINANPLVGIVPFDVAFQAAVAGGDAPFSYLWAFGDGATSVQPNPTHRYVTAGTYTVVVTVTDADGDAAVAHAQVSATSDGTPVVEIAAEPMSGIAPLQVRFQASVAGGNAPIRYEWNLGGGVTAAVPNPVHTFAAGTHTVGLTVRDADGDVASDTVTIVVDADSVPEVSALPQPPAGMAPLTVAFTCDAVGGNAPLTYHWEFGDGATSALANPSHTYSNAGAYVAICRVTDADGDMAQGLASVDVVADTAPQVGVRAEPTHGLAPLAVQFQSMVAGGNPPLTYQWNFGDGPAMDMAEAPLYVYGMAGSYVATLTVTDADGDQGFADVAISVGDAMMPAAEITIDPTSGVAPLLARFHCEAVGGNPPYTYRWTFGDGASADTPDAEHMFTLPGEFQPRCTVTDAFGQTGSQSSWVDVAPSNTAPFIDVLFLDNGWPDTAPECAAAGQTQMLLTVVAGDADGDPLSYEWRFDEVPPGSTASFNNPGVMNPAFVPDLPGTYVARVFVRDGQGGQASGTLVVNAETPNGVIVVSPEPPLAGVADEPFPEPLVARVETACGVPFAGVPVQWSAINGSLITAADVSDAAGRVTATVRLGCLAGDLAEFQVVVGGLEWGAHFGISVGSNAPAALILEAEQDVPIVDAGGNPVPMAVTARLLDRCGNAVVDSDVTFDLHVEPSSPVCLSAPCSESGVKDLVGLQTVGGALSVEAFSTVVGEIPFWADNLSDPSMVSGGWRVGQPLDFEADGGGFMSGAIDSYPDEWEWGEPTMPVTAHSGTRAWDTRLDEDYLPSIGGWSEHRFLLRNLNLPCNGGMPIELRFWEYHDIGDHALARVAADCAQCPELVPLDTETAYNATLDGFSGYQGISDGWREVRMDLAPWHCNEVNVFWDLYLNQAGETRAGWTIDDVSLRYFSEWVTGRFVAGPPYSGTVSVMAGGVVGCPTADASVWLQVNDIAGNPVPGAEVQVDFAGTGSVLVTDVENGELLSQGAGTATIRIDDFPVRVQFSNVVAETVTVTLPDLVNPWGDGGTPTGTTQFIDIADETPAAGTCFDGFDNDCDGFSDCADDACAAEPACMPDLIAWYHNWDPASSSYEVAFCNYGLVGTSGPFEIAMYVRGPGGAEPVPPNDASWAAVREYPEDLPVMACNSVVFSGNLTFGDYELYAVLDWDNRIPEAHEDDNLIMPGMPMQVSIPFGGWESPVNGNCLDGIDNEPDLMTDCESLAGVPACKTDPICQNFGSPIDPLCNGVDDSPLGLPDLAACRCVIDSGCDAIGPGYRCYDEMNQFGPDQAFCAPPCGDTWWLSAFPGLPSYDMICDLLTGGLLNICDKDTGRCM